MSREKREIRGAKPSFREQHIKKKKERKEEEGDYAATSFLSLECNVARAGKKKHYFVACFSSHFEDSAAKMKKFTEVSDPFPRQKFIEKRIYTVLQSSENLLKGDR